MHSLKLSTFVNSTVDHHRDGLVASPLSFTKIGVIFHDLFNALWDDRGQIHPIFAPCSQKW